ncbi:MAG TPA: M1 family aminopeptidase [Terriglobales bacterium]|nr:M1 family aminopeptidase [Terriglobales bacterium]
MAQLFPSWITKVLLPLLVLAVAAAPAQNLPPHNSASAVGAPAQPSASPAVSLYRELLNPVLEPRDVHAIRQVSIEHEDIHIALSDGTIGLIRAADGRVTGAVFEGMGEVLLIVPGRAERTSMTLFTGSAVLEQVFTTAYLRFVDEGLVNELSAGFRPADGSDAQDFAERWKQPARDLARGDSLQLLQALTNSGDAAVRYLHARVAGTQLGIFDIFLDTNSQEQISVAQASVHDKEAYYDIWSSFPMRSARNATAGESPHVPRFELSEYRLNVSVEPPTNLSAEAELSLTPRRSGQRTVILELSRFLRVSEVRMNGEPVEFIQNEAMSGSDLARRGDDLIGVVFPRALEPGKPVRLSFKYSGPVMYDQGGELLYVGARGTWYPNAGAMFSNFDLTFSCPEDWSLVATGRQVSSTVENERRIVRFITPKPISRAGFNLGKFDAAEASVGDVTIHAFAARKVEPLLAAREARLGRRPEPAREVRQIADQAANTVKFLSAELDPFPYQSLAVTQLPGFLSQSWPGLIYLSSMAFLDRDERRAAGVRDPYVELLLSKLMLAHETGHQWWGDAVDWVSYRDEWIIEALANYSALLMLERDDPKAMKIALDYYREELLRARGNGIMSDAGPVTLGPRLTSSRFPDAYEKVLYGRGTWLIHMLRTMLRQATGSKDDALFFVALRGLLARSPTHKISTHDLQLAFEQVLPASLAYEKKKSLEWFFDSWVNGDSIPQLNLDRVTLKSAGNRVRASGVVRQSKAGRDLVTAVPIYAVDALGKQTFLAFVFADEPESEFSLTAPAGTRHLVLDPENTVLRR